MTAARAVALILAWVRRERIAAVRGLMLTNERRTRLETLDALEEYIKTLLPGKGKGGK